MAPLTDPHWEAVSAPLRDLLAFIGQQAFAQRFYLAGGTALALRLGHRRSYDLDFFSETDEVLADTRKEILAALAERQPRTLEDVDGNLLLLISGLRAGFFSYGYPLLERPEAIEGIAVASIVDVGLMKLDALISRGSRKDFYDLYFVAQGMPISDLLAMSNSLQKRIHNLVHQVLASYPGAWMVWRDPRGDWAPLLQRVASYGNLWGRWFESPAGQWSTRDMRSVNRTFAGLTKLIFPSGVMEKADAELLLRLALELRLRVRRQLHQINPQEFPLTEFGYVDSETGVTKAVKITV